MYGRGYRPEAQQGRVGALNLLGDWEGLEICRPINNLKDLCLSSPFRQQLMNALRRNSEWAFPE